MPAIINFVPLFLWMLAAPYCLRKARMDSSEQAVAYVFGNGIWLILGTALCYYKHA